MKKWIKICIVILTFAIVSITIYFILQAYDLTDVSKIKQLISQSKEYGLLVYFIICTFSSVLLCFVPILGTALTSIGIVLFGPIYTCVVTILSNLVSSSVLFLIGDKLGENFARKLIGRESFEQAQDLINGKSKAILPILYIIPIFPHEALTLVAGMTKLKYWYVILVNFMHSIIDLILALFIAGDIIIWSNLRLIDWMVLINLLIIDIVYLFKINNKISKN